MAASKVFCLLAVMLLAALNCNAAIVGRFEIVVPRIVLEDFEYVPTNEGYRYSYNLVDGTRYVERGIIPNAAAKSAVRSKPSKASRPRGTTKNRKLSPKSLQSLAG